MELSQYSELIQSVLGVMITILVPILAKLLKSWVDKQIALIAMQLSESQLLFAKEMIDRFVKAAEQLDLVDILKRTGAEKKEWVINRVNTELAKVGIDIDEYLLADMIEAAVFEGLGMEPILIEEPME